MPFWTFYGLRQGTASTRWPYGGSDGQQGVLGMPRFDRARCEDGCRRCAEVCVTGAIQHAPAPADHPTGAAPVGIDYGRCIACQLCVEACPTGALSVSGDWAFGARRREDLVWAEASASDEAHALRREMRRVFGRSLHIRHVDAGSCNGCESELQALNNPYYNLHRLGIFFTPSPRFADLLLVTGAVTYAMREPLRAAYAAMPEPRFVLALGTCAVSGGAAAGGYAGGHGLEGVLPVDVYLPGCPPNPAAIIHALLMLLTRLPQRLRGGQLAPGDAHA